MFYFSKLISNAYKIPNRTFILYLYYYFFMQKFSIHFLLFVGFIMLLTLSCHRDKEVVCTALFARVSIEVNGSSLNDFYTLRMNTSDTLRFPDGHFQNTYTVLDDNYQKVLENKSENFKFIGIISGIKVVDENFVISADKCHISKISGKNFVTI